MVVNRLSNIAIVWQIYPCVASSGISLMPLITVSTVVRFVPYFIHHRVLDLFVGYLCCSYHGMRCLEYFSMILQPMNSCPNVGFRVITVDGKLGKTIFDGDSCIIIVVCGKFG